MKIIINATPVDVPNEPLGYDKIVDLANTQWGKKALHSVTYSHKVPFMELPGERHGTLTPGKSVDPSEGMIIDAVVTGSA